MIGINPPVGLRELIDFNTHTGLCLLRDVCLAARFEKKPVRINDSQNMEPGVCVCVCVCACVCVFNG